MFNFHSIDHTSLDSKIKELSDKIERAQPVLGNPSKDQWEEIFTFCIEIKGYFKNVRYPSKNDRENAWQTFSNLWNKASKIRHDQNYSISKDHYNSLMGRLGHAYYGATTDFIFGEILSFGVLKTTADEMKEKGRELGNITAHFKSVKLEMIAEHKAEVFKRVGEVRQSHEGFWGQYNKYQAENFRANEEKQRVWLEKKQIREEKSREIRARIERNLEGNRQKLYKAEEASERMKRKRDELQSKIYDSNSDNWKSKAEGWLDEFNEKIRSIVEQIDRLKRWIDEDRDKLSRWN